MIEASNMDRRPTRRHDTPTHSVLRQRLLWQVCVAGRHWSGHSIPLHVSVHSRPPPPPSIWAYLPLQSRCCPSSEQVCLCGAVRRHSAHAPAAPRAVQVIEVLKKRGGRAHLVLATHELGDVHAHFGDWRGASVAWNDALDMLLGPYQARRAGGRGGGRRCVVTCLILVRGGGLCRCRERHDGCTIDSRTISLCNRLYNQY